MSNRHLELTAKQRANWIALFNYMDTTSEYEYCHNTFATPDDNETSFCIFSFILRNPACPFKRNPDVENDGYNDVVAEYDDALALHYCSNFSKNIGNYDSKFGDFMNESDYSRYEEHSPRHITKLLREFLGLNDHIKHYTVQWKNNSKDRFSSREALDQFFELNPHRQNSYRKITVTKTIERIVYDDVEEAFAVSR